MTPVERAYARDRVARLRLALPTLPERPVLTASSSLVRTEAKRKPVSAGRSESVPRLKQKHRCVYCGWDTKGLTCSAHSDLPDLDERYSDNPLERASGQRRRRAA